MQQYLIRRVLLMIPTLIIVTVIIFSMVRILPGDVVLQQVSEYPAYSEDEIEALRDKLGINRSWLAQYPEWLGGVVVGNLGTSLWSNDDIGALIIDRIPVTLELAILAFIMANSIALVFGAISAIRQDTSVDYVLRVLSITGLSMPNFWIATMVIIFGARLLNYLPPLRYTPFMDDPLTNLEQFILPAGILGVALSSSIMRMTRSAVLEVLRQDYVRTAWAKGLRERQIVIRHVLKNALMPVVTLQGTQLAFLLSGSVIIEIIFSLPGIGLLTYDSILNRDYTVVQATTLVFGAIFMLINLTVDLSYAWLDPRVKYT